METIYTHAIIEDEKIKGLLQETFPELKVFKYDLINESEPENGFNKENSTHIFFHTRFDGTKIEFGNQINIYRTPDENSEERSIFIGKRLSQKFGLVTLVTYTNPEDPSPYYDLIFQENLTYLADDMNSNLADNGIEKVKILKQINLPQYQFDELGNLLT